MTRSSDWKFRPCDPAVGRLSTCCADRSLCTLAVLRLQLLRRRSHNDLLRLRGDLQLRIHALNVIQADVYILGNTVSESRGFDRDLVGSLLQVAKSINAAAIRGGGLLGAGGNVQGINLRPGNSRSGAVSDSSGQRPVQHLCRRRTPAAKHQHEHHETGDNRLHTLPLPSTRLADRISRTHGTPPLKNNVATHEPRNMPNETS